MFPVTVGAAAAVGAEDAGPDGAVAGVDAAGDVDEPGEPGALALQAVTATSAMREAAHAATLVGGVMAAKLRQAGHFGG
jgi:hypothetical protein